MALCCISFALLLVALAAGMFLLAKTNKDNLGNLFRFVSWFIIVSTFLGIIGCGMCCMLRMCCHSNMDRNTMMYDRCGMNQDCGGMMPGNFNKKIMIRDWDEKECDGMKGNCEMKGGCEMKGSCEKGGSCCMDGMKEKNMDLKKDSVVIKK